MQTAHLRALVAEAIGTFALTFIGVLAISNEFIAGAPTPPSLALVAFAHGLTIAVMVAALSMHSGGHFNPAITLGFVLSGRMHIKDGGLYWVAQLVGAAIASFLILWTTDVSAVDRGMPAVAENIGVGLAVILEAVATFFLVLVVFGTAVEERAPKSVFPFAIGLTLTAGIMAIGPLTGGALNPARAFGPALAAGDWHNHWVYWVGPLLGGAFAALLQQYLLLARAPSFETAVRGGPAPSEKRR